MRSVPAAALLLCAVPQTAVAAPRVVADTSRVVLGETDAVVLRVIAGGTLSASVSSGSIAEAARRGDQHTFRWTPPPLRFPATALLAFWESDAATPDVTVFTLPLWGRTTLDMDTEPGADVRVQVGESTFGPVKANAKGRVRVPIEVPPGVRTAKVIAVAKGQQTSRTVPLDVPRTTPFVVAVGPDPLPGGGGWLAVLSTGEVSARTFTARAVGARLSELDRDDRRATWTLTPTGSAGSPIEVTIDGPGLERRVLSLAVGERVNSPPAESQVPIVPHALLGGFFAGGANTGFAAEVGAEVRPAAVPSWLSVGLDVGVRSASLRTSLNGLGSVHSSVLAFPIGPFARARLYAKAPFAIDLRAGLAALPFRHSFTAAFEQPWVEGGVGLEAAAGPEVLYRLGPMELALDVRGAWTVARTAHLVAHPGGLLLTAGARYVGR
ncbi:MAG: hypothetical protein IRZ16_09595 [Myxococcaceae bacterium]|nr:hypothetical protein [Myxococcaceae bacterium]